MQFVKRSHSIRLPALLAAGWLCLALPVCAADSVALPGFRELFSLIESNLAGLLPAELEQAATRGLLRELNGRVSLVTNETATATNAAGVLRTNVFGGAYGYLRLGRMEPETAGQFKGAVQALRATNELKGLVIDLRQTRGTNYAAAMAVADLFLPKETPLLHVEETLLKSTGQSDPIRLPMAVLVNRRTAEAGEALAAVLRQHSAGLILGARTAGQAMIYREFVLSNGQRVRLAAKYIRVADGGLLPSKGLKPDIEVEVAEADERRYFEDPFAMLAGAGDPAGRSANRPLNEAELVRRHREGQNPDAEPVAEPATPAQTAEPPVRDPVLGRALDLLKGLAVMKKLQ
jgi:hypothetical protein